MITNRRIQDLLSQLYAPSEVPGICQRLEAIITNYAGRLAAPNRVDLDQRDTILITYPDQVREVGTPPLRSLEDFADRYLADIVSGIHVLPFYPWSSDDGFSVMDYRDVAPAYGTWSDLSRLGERFRLMVDLVLNHASAESPWFTAFLQERAPYSDYFIRVEGNPDLSAVIRPRAQPLLTRFRGQRGNMDVWTTFSADQIDLNYRNAKVLLEFLDILLYYVSQGADFVRLDAVAYIWKEFGTSCANLEQAHLIVRLMRAVLDQVAPHVMLVTEVNFPQSENIRYFGDGLNEAHLVYNFALPPLVLHAVTTGQAEYLTTWAANLALPSDTANFFNFLASHDGIGLNGVKGLLPITETDDLLRRMQKVGGLISYRNNADGNVSPYEINASYLEALKDPDRPDDLGATIDRFVLAHAILLALKGLPGIYFHSLFGSRGWLDGVSKTGRNRSINREKLERTRLEAELANPAGRRAQIYNRLRRLLKIRAAASAFSPRAEQRILTVHPKVFALARHDHDTGKQVICLHNVSDEEHIVSHPDLAIAGAVTPEAQDLVSGETLHLPRDSKIALKPYQAMWIAL